MECNDPHEPIACFGDIAAASGETADAPAMTAADLRKFRLFILLLI